MGGRSFFSLLWVALLAAVAVASAACGGRDAEPTVATFVLLPTPTPSPVPTLSPTPTPRPTPSPSPSPTPTPTASPIPSATPTPIPAPTPTLPLASPALTVEPDTVAQGQVVLARLTGVDAQNVSLSLAGTRYVMVREGDTWWAVVGVGALFQPGEYEATATWEGESTAAALAVVAADFGREEIELPPEASELLLDPVRIQDERQVLAVAHATFTPRRLWQGLFVMPAQGPISNPFGLMRSINGGGYIPHSGTDVVADEGAPVVAANEGQAVLARELYLFGNTVVIDHGGGVLSGYHHLSQIAVAEGQTVAKGEAIGAVGETGLVTGPHLHWEVVVHGVRVDPALWTLREVAP